MGKQGLLAVTASLPSSVGRDDPLVTAVEFSPLPPALGPRVSNQQCVGCGILPLWRLRNNCGISLNRDFP